MRACEGSRMKQRAVVDRIVDGVNVVLLVGDKESEVVVPVGKLPPGASEGAWLLVRFDGGQLIEAEVDTEETMRVRQRIGEKLRRLREQGKRRT